MWQYSILYFFLSFFLDQVLLIKFCNSSYLIISKVHEIVDIVTVVAVGRSCAERADRSAHLAHLCLLGLLSSLKLRQRVLDFSQSFGMKVGTLLLGGAIVVLEWQDIFYESLLYHVLNNEPKGWLNIIVSWN